MCVCVCVCVYVCIYGPHTQLRLFFFIDDITLCLIIYKVNKLFTVAIKHNNSISTY